MRLDADDSLVLLLCLGMFPYSTWCKGRDYNYTVEMGTIGHGEAEIATRPICSCGLRVHVVDGNIAFALNQEPSSCFIIRAMFEFCYSSSTMLGWVILLEGYSPLSTRGLLVL